MSQALLKISQQVEINWPTSELEWAKQQLRNFPANEQFLINWLACIYKTGDYAKVNHEYKKIERDFKYSTKTREMLGEVISILSGKIRDRAMMGCDV